MDSKSFSTKNVILLYALSLSVSLGSLVMGFSLVCLTMLQFQIKAKNQLSPDASTLYFSVATSFLPLGALLSSLAYRKAVSNYGEGNLMKYSDIAFVVIYGIQSMTLNINLLIFLRLMLGLILGISGIAVPSYLISLAPTSMSGKLGSFNQIFITIGITLAYAMGFIINQDASDEIRWRIFMLFPIPFALIRFFSLKYLFRFDTLERHIAKNEKDKLHQYIQMFYIDGKMTVEELILEKSPQQQIQITEIKPKEKSKDGLKKRVTLSIILCVINQFSGINAILFYSKQLFQNISNGDSSFAVQMSLYLGLFQNIVTIFSGAMLDKFGRKTLMVGGQILITIALFLGYLMLNVMSGISPLWVGLILFMHIGGFSLSLGPITILYISQILEDISQYMVLLWVQTIIIALTSNIMIVKLGIGIVFLIYGVIAGLGVLFTMKEMRESKGKTRNEMADIFQHGEKYKKVSSFEEI